MCTLRGSCVPTSDVTSSSRLDISELWFLLRTIFKGYTPFTVTAKYWLCSLCCVGLCILVTCLTSKSLYLTLQHLSTVPPFPLPTVNH